MKKQKQTTKAATSSCSAETPGYADCWTDATITLPPENTKVLVCTDKDLLFCGIYQRLSRHVGQNAPKDDRWFASPGLGHELKVKYWRVLPSLPLTA